MAVVKEVTSGTSISTVAVSPGAAVYVTVVNTDPEVLVKVVVGTGTFSTTTAVPLVVKVDNSVKLPVQVPVVYDVTSGKSTSTVAVSPGEAVYVTVVQTDPEVLVMVVVGTGTFSTITTVPLVVYDEDSVNEPVQVAVVNVIDSGTSTSTVAVFPGEAVNVLVVSSDPLV